MASICLYFQVHQPHRLRRYSVFDSSADYFDTARNQQILDRVVNKCYLPATRLLLELIRKYDGHFRLAFSVTGSVLEQFAERHPQVIARFQELAKTGCVEFLSETYYHSLAFLYSRDEFKAQVDLHTGLMQELFGQTPRVFRNTELIYSNELSQYLAAMDRFTGVLTEGADRVLGRRSPNCLYWPPQDHRLKLLLKNYRLSDDVAFRFSNRSWNEWPLTADKFTRWIQQIDGVESTCNLFMDFETFGEHQWSDTGIFEFLQAFPSEVFRLNGASFLTPSEAIARYEPAGDYDVPHMISWADTERDLSAWLGNAMQSNALYELYRLERPVKESGDVKLLEDWRRLTTSDHVYYMCTKYFGDAVVHKYFNPYESPYDSYINFMNVLDNLRTRLNAEAEAPEGAAERRLEIATGASPWKGAAPPLSSFFNSIPGRGD